MQTHKDPSKGKKDPSNSGRWRPTQLGIDFVHGRVSVPRIAWDYGGRCWELDDSKGTVTIHDALGKQFSYDELMQGPLV